MNEVFRTRLVGLAVLLAALFLLSLLLPKEDAPGAGNAATTVSLIEPLSGAATAPAPQPAVVSEPAAPSSSSKVSVPHEAPAISALGDEAPVVEHSSAAVPAVAPVPSPAPTRPAVPKVAVVARAEPSKAEKPAVVKTPVEKSKVETPKAEKPKPGLGAAASAPARPVVPEPVKPVPAKPAVVAKTPDAPASAAKSPSSNGGWFVQIGSYSDPGNAETIVSLLKPLGYRIDSARIIGSAKKPLYRVRLGAFASEAEARQAQQRVARQGYPQSRVVSEPASKQ